MTGENKRKITVQLSDLDETVYNMIKSGKRLMSPEIYIFLAQNVRIKRSLQKLKAVGLIKSENFNWYVIDKKA